MSFSCRSGDTNELYDLRRDAGETENLYGAGELAEVQRELESRLLSWYIQTSDQVPFEKSPRGLPG